MKRFIFFWIVVAASGCAKINHTNTYTRAANVIADGQGFDSFEIDKTRASDVIERLGHQFEEINNNNYSIQLYYRELGVSFYYMQQDSVKEIFSIVFSKPFKGRTSKGIVLGESTMEDVVRIYGEPDWTTCENCEFWTSEYDGIQFSVAREKSLPQFPLDEELHLKKKIAEIEVIND